MCRYTWDLWLAPWKWVLHHDTPVAMMMGDQVANSLAPQRWKCREVAIKIIERRKLLLDLLSFGVWKLTQSHVKPGRDTTPESTLELWDRNLLGSQAHDTRLQYPNLKACPGAWWISVFLEDLPWKGPGFGAAPPKSRPHFKVRHPMGHIAAKIWTNLSNCGVLWTSKYHWILKNHTKSVIFQSIAGVLKPGTWHRCDQSCSCSWFMVCVPAAPRLQNINTGSRKNRSQTWQKIEVWCSSLGESGDSLDLHTKKMKKQIWGHAWMISGWKKTGSSPLWGFERRLPQICPQPNHYCGKPNAITATNYPPNLSQKGGITIRNGVYVYIYICIYIYMF